MFDSGGSSGVLRDELGVLPPGDVLKCALALARNEREARRVLLSRLPTLEHARLGGHTGGNLLLSMMEQYTGDFLAAVDGLRGLLGCAGRVWPVSVEQASVCAEYGTARARAAKSKSTPGRTPATRVTRLWLEPDVQLHPAAAAAIRAVRGGDHRPGQLLHQPDADLPGAGRAGGDPPDAGPDRPRHEPADRRARHVRLHRRRRRPTARARRSAGRSTSSIVNTSRPSAERSRATRRSTRRRWRSARFRPRRELVTRRVLVRRHRASRSPPARAGGLGGARAAVAVAWPARQRPERLSV